MNRGKVRDEQLANLIAEELEFVLNSARDPRLSELQITAIEPGPGGKHFLILVAPNENANTCFSAEEIKLVLKRATPFFRYELAQLLNLKKAPDLTFIIDPLFTAPKS